MEGLRFTFIDGNVVEINANTYEWHSYDFLSNRLIGFHITLSDLSYRSYWTIKSIAPIVDAYPSCNTSILTISTVSNMVAYISQGPETQAITVQDSVSLSYA